ncbi:CPBP family intramembrane glutamic endopeptidase [Draconibacterium mangrovi]|uniref:CPBP family intramembrane glutamic endopeptidase n=1 Tax=Draconibacterium mangrovi TaxID=2697469 RepID=UPI0013D00A30|nr:CPBP family intramembrane glutamic endopeptidase [Draconibacterium mangrovi]
MSKKEAGNHPSTFGKQLQINPVYIIGEILLLFIIGLGFVKLVTPLFEENLILKQIVVWFANILLLIYVWIGLKLRGESWKELGLTFNSLSWSEGFKTFLLSLLVTVLGLAAYILGGIVMAGITGTPETADMAGYDYLKNNIGMLLLTLIGVYIVSSFGEEVIYRAFLISRISKLGHDSKKATIVAVLLSSIIFGFIHYDWGSAGIVQTACMGLVMGICYIKLKRRLWILVLAHAYMDTILMIGVYLASN